MSLFIAKILIAVGLVVIASELARSDTLLGALIASLPLVSLLTILWLWLDNRDDELVARFSIDVLWMVLPSLVLFILLPILIRCGWPVGLALLVAAAATVAAYATTTWILGHDRSEATEEPRSG